MGKLQYVPFKIGVGMPYDCDRVKGTRPFGGGWGTDLASFLTAAAKQLTNATQGSQGFLWLQFHHGSKGTRQLGTSHPHSGSRE